MPLLTQYRSFFISPFGESTVCDELNTFLKSNRIVNVEKHLIDSERKTGWLFLIEYASENKNHQSVSTQRVDYREILNEQEYAQFDKLRQLRKELAEKQGVPVYAIFTNDHLAAMIKNKIKTIKDISSIAGVGESRAKQYGNDFLKLFIVQTNTPNETPELPL
jgi:superfamily II DNA helicase RecQ